MWTKMDTNRHGQGNRWEVSWESQSLKNKKIQSWRRSFLISFGGKKVRRHEGGIRLGSLPGEDLKSGSDLIMQTWIQEEVSGWTETLNEQRQRREKQDLARSMWPEQGCQQSISGRRIQLKRWEVVSLKSYDNLMDSYHQMEDQCNVYKALKVKSMGYSDSTF